MSELSRRLYRQPASAAAALLSLGLLLAPQTSTAFAFLDVSANSRSPAYDDIDAQAASDSSGLTFISVGSRLSGSIIEGGGNTSAFALAAPGYLRAVAGSSGFATSGTLESNAFALLIDSFVIDDPLLNGTQGSAVALVDIVHVQGIPLGTVIGAGGMQAGSILDVTVGNTRQVHQMTSSLFEEPGFEVTGMIPQQLSLPFVFTYGSSVSVSVALGVSASLFAPGEPNLAQGTSLARFPSSFRWMGIDGLSEDAVVLGSFDWSQPAAVVPVPGAVWLFISGLLSLAALRRRHT